MWYTRNMDKRRIDVLEDQVNRLSQLVLKLVEDRYLEDWVVEAELVEIPPQLEKGKNGDRP